MTVQVIASGSGGNAYALHSEGEASLLLEAGVKYRELQVALNHQVTQLAGCVLSHEHLDHAASAERLTRAGVRVHATPGTLAALNLTGHRVVPLSLLEQHRVGSWRVTPFKAVHDAAEPAGFLIEDAQGDRLLFITDSAWCAYTFPGINLVLIECNYDVEMLNGAVMKGKLLPQVAARTIRNHMSLANCIKTLQANDLSHCRQIVLLHLSNGNSHEVRFKQAVEAATGIPTTIAPEKGLLA